MLGTESAFQLMAFALAGTTILAGAGCRLLLDRRKKLEAELGANREVLDNLNEGFYRSSIDGRQLYANKALARLNGYSSGEEQISAVNDIASEWYVDPGRREQFINMLYEKGRVSGFVSEIYRHRTRERVWISEEARLVCDPESGEPLYFEGTVREITDEIRYRELQDRLTKLAANLPGGLFHMVRDAEGHFSTPYLSASFLRLFGYEENTIIDRPNKFLSRIHPEDVGTYLSALQTTAATLEPLDIRMRVTDKQGKTRWFHVTATTEANSAGDISWYGNVTDITARRQEEQQLEKLAYFDQLTNLPKRSMLEDRLVSTIAACNRREEHAALLFLDLDNFKVLNDTHGHETGDLLLRQVAQRLATLIRASDMVSRYAGDEFVILIDNLGKDADTAKSNASAFADKVLASFAEPFQLDEIEQTASPSIGVAMISAGMPSVEEIVSQADAAMYAAKKNGRNTYVLAEAGNSGDADQFDIRSELLEAIDGDDLELMLQPQMDSRGRICGAEAFLRWNHPTRGVLPPSQFVPHAERNGSILALNGWVIRKAVKILAKWKEDPKLKSLPLSVNVSVQQFASEQFATDLGRLLTEAGIEPSLLTLELTENVMSRNLDRAASQMAEVKKTGVRLSLDDFGTGSSSLSNLNRLPFDEVKIDGAFVSSIESEAKNRSLIEGILGIASALGLDTVAEHVSSRFQENYLREKGCKRFQGYFYHPPLSRDAFEALVERSETRPVLAVAS